jgi:hypothetical protein
MLELTTRVQKLLRTESASKDRRSRVLDEVAILQSDAPQSVESASEDLNFDPTTLQHISLRKELDRRIAARKNYAELAELTRQLRGMLDQEKQSPQTPRNRAFVNAADGVVGFLEQIFQDAHSPDTASDFAHRKTRRKSS